ncbi:MAG: hypothetical protein ABI664_11160 [bacterium]
MSRPDARVIATAPESAARPPASSLIEHCLQALGADPAFTDAVFGDLAEEYAGRAMRQGVVAARMHYASNIFRSAPYLMASAIRQGGTRARIRVGASVAMLALLITVGVVALLARAGPPARLVAGVGASAGGIVVNNVKPAQLEMLVLDKSGRQLASREVRYRWASGAPISISANGVVTCTRHGDARVRASLGAIATDFDVWCRPVQEVRAFSWIDFIAGDPPRHLPFVAIGLDGNAVTELRGAASVFDTSVAKLEGSSIRPMAVGRTVVSVDVGDKNALMQVIVHEPVRTFDGLRANQRNVAVPVHLARGDTISWTLPKGVFWLKYLSRRPGEAPPTITVDGDISCSGGNGIRSYLVSLDVFATYCLVRTHGATVILAHGAFGIYVVDGALALERVSP